MCNTYCSIEIGLKFEIIIATVENFGVDQTYSKSGTYESYLQDHK